MAVIVSVVKFGSKLFESEELLFAFETVFVDEVTKGCVPVVAVSLDFEEFKRL